MISRSDQRRSLEAKRNGGVPRSVCEGVRRSYATYLDDYFTMHKAFKLP